MRLLLLLLVLAACDSPSPAFMGRPSSQQKVGGMAFTVRHHGTEAEAIRTSRHWRPDTETVARNARTAIEAATGCKVKRLDGDAAILTARLIC